MEIEKLEWFLSQLRTVKNGEVYYDNNTVKRQFSELIRLSISAIPEHQTKITDLRSKVMNRPHGPFGSDIISACQIITVLLEKTKRKESKTAKQFLNSDDLLKQAGGALRNGQEAYSINLCDSAIEVFLKEMFDVPSTIVGAGNVKFLSECIILDIPPGMELYLKEVKNKVCQMNNQIKHKAYIPSRLDAINALKATEELIVRKNRFRTVAVTEKRKVQAGIDIDNKNKITSKL